MRPIRDRHRRTLQTLGVLAAAAALIAVAFAWVSRSPSTPAVPETWLSADVPTNGRDDSTPTADRALFLERPARTATAADAADPGTATVSRPSALESAPEFEPWSADLADLASRAMIEWSIAAVEAPLSGLDRQVPEDAWNLDDAVALAGGGDVLDLDLALGTVSEGLPSADARFAGTVLVGIRVPWSSSVLVANDAGAQRVNLRGVATVVESDNGPQVVATTFDDPKWGMVEVVAVDASLPLPDPLQV